MALNIIETYRPGVCFVGDIHGEFNSIQGLMKRTEFTDTMYVFNGDCGFGFEKEQHYKNIFNKLNKTAAQFNNECIFIRGNHDSKEYFNGKKINRKYFKAIPDYTVVQTPTHNILCVGGATSIDRTYRLVKYKENAMKYAIYHGCSIDEAYLYCPKGYWSDEAPVYDEEALNELKESGIKIDIVATHTCPSFAKPITKESIQYWLTEDPTLEADIDAERKVMDDLYNKLIEDGHPLYKWFYGHYHFHNQEYINGIQFVMLDKWRNGNFDIYDLNF
jgi:UDP-2,3-diacylglucosamine pyrophosphatase LpxH